MKRLFCVICIFSVNFLIVNNIYSSPPKEVKQNQTKEKTNWKFESRLIGIDKIKMSFLKTKSLNSLDLQFPYNGKNFGEIILRYSEKNDLEILLTVDKGQIQCGISDCKGRIKFGNSPSIEFEGTPPSDRSSNVIFIDNENDLVKLFQSSTKVLIEIPMYQSGNQILEFNVSGLNIEMLGRNKTLP